MGLQLNCKSYASNDDVLSNDLVGGIGLDWTKWLEDALGGKARNYYDINILDVISIDLSISGEANHVLCGLRDIWPQIIQRGSDALCCASFGRILRTDNFDHAFRLLSTCEPSKCAVRVTPMIIEVHERERGCVAKVADRSIFCGDLFCCPEGLFLAPEGMREDHDALPGWTMHAGKAPKHSKL
jgi:hypothetical protein